MQKSGWAFVPLSPSVQSWSDRYPWKQQQVTAGWLWWGKPSCPHDIYSGEPGRERGRKHSAVMTVTAMRKNVQMRWEDDPPHATGDHKHHLPRVAPIGRRRSRFLKRRKLLTGDHCQRWSGESSEREKEALRATGEEEDFIFRSSECHGALTTLPWWLDKADTWCWPHGSHAHPDCTTHRGIWNDALPPITKFVLFKQ